MACNTYIVIEQMSAPEVVVDGSQVTVVVEQCAPSETAGDTTWDEITDKPSEFPAEAHTHPISEVDGLQTALDGKSATGHGHNISDVTGLQTALDGKAASSHTHSISDITALQTALDGKSNVGHGHAISDVTGLQAALDGKSSTGHTHSISDITALQTALDGKSNVGHGHAIAEVTGLQAALDGKSDVGHTHSIANVTGLQAALDAKADKTELFQPSRRVEWMDDFIGGSTETGEIGQMGWETSVSSGSVVTEAAEAGRPGVKRITSLTNATGRATVYLGQSEVLIGGGQITIEMGIYLAAVPDVTNDFTVEIGLGDGPSGSTVDGVYFIVRRITNATNWLAATISNSTPTLTDTGVAMEVGWSRFKIIIDDTASEAKFYINDTLVATNTTNLPTASGRSCAPQLKCIGLAGASANRYILVDYYKFCQVFTTPR